MAEVSKEIQEKYIMLELLRRQIDQVQEQMTNTQSKILELTNSIDSLDELKEYKKGTEVLVPLGANSFAKAKLLGVEKLWMDVGAGVMIEKKLEKSKETIRDQIKILEQVGQKLGERLKNLNLQVRKLQMELSKNV